MLVTPDDTGRYVVWDRTEGSYDRYLERLRAERSVADPQPLSPEQLTQLLAAIQAEDDPDERHWARVELELYQHDTDPWHEGLAEHSDCVDHAG